MVNLLVIALVASLEGVWQWYSLIMGSIIYNDVV